VFEGTADAVERMIEFCHEGRNVARVDAVDVTYEESGSAGDPGLNRRGKRSHNGENSEGTKLFIPNRRR
jgi:hypothetical protein